MPLRVLVNGVDKGLLNRPGGTAFVIVNWIVGRDSQDIFLAAARERRFQSVEPGDSVEIVVERPADVPSTPTFNDSIGTRSRPAEMTFGYDVFVNDALVRSVRLSADSDITTALVFVHDHEVEPRLNVRAGGEEIVSRLLAFGDRVRIELRSQPLP